MANLQWKSPDVPGMTQPDAGGNDKHFSVLIVAAVLTLFLGVYVLEIHWSGNDVVIGWLQTKMDMLIGALLMGLTGGAMNAVRK